MTEPLAALARFGRALRDGGLAVGPGRIDDFCRAAALARARRSLLGRAARRSSRGRDEIPVYDRGLPRVLRRTPSREPRRAHPRRVTRDVGEDGEAELALASPRSSCCSEKSFVALHAGGARAARRADGAQLGSRCRSGGRAARSRRGRGAPDLRRTLRRSFRTGGEPLERAWRERRRRAAAARAPARRLGLDGRLLARAARLRPRRRFAPTGAGRRSASARG